MIAAFIQARLGSTRLPNKVLADIGGSTSVALVVAAAGEVSGIEKIRVLWAEDFPWCAENDVLTRYYAAWRNAGEPDAVMRLTADCPLIDTQVLQLVLNAYTQSNAMYVSNIYPRRTFPDGMDCEVFTGELLLKAHLEATNDYDREHVTPWMQRYVKATLNVTLPVDWSHWRLTLDTERDLEWLRRVVEYHGEG